VDYAADALLQGFRAMALSCRHRFELASRELASYSPLAILKRGYAVVTHERTRTILLSAQAVRQGDSLSIKLSEGGMHATVEDTHAVEK
jgi:exodeoxyribonuclease VII large subunit